MSERSSIKEFREKLDHLRIFVHENCPVVTPIHKLNGRKEARDKGRSTCGLGVGLACKDFANKRTLFAGELRYKDQMRKKLDFISQGYEVTLKKSELDDLIEKYYAFSQEYSIIGNKDMARLVYFNDTIIYEMSQGILLSPLYGFKPHISHTSYSPQIIESMYEIEYIGVSRCYSHRHGVGHFPVESIDMEEKHNVTNEWRGEFRTGQFSVGLFNYALNRANVGRNVAITHLDKHPDSRLFLDQLKEFDVNIVLESYGPTADDKIWRK